MQGRPHSVPICAALVGVLLLRALIPTGYMPASAGSGLLFELCPTQLPVGFSAGTSGHDHHHSSENAASKACDFGHILADAWIDGLVDESAIVDKLPESPIVGVLRSVALAVRRYYASRAPPTP